MANSSSKSGIILWELILYAGHTSIPTNYTAIPVLKQLRRLLHVLFYCLEDVEDVEGGKQWGLAQPQQA